MADKQRLGTSWRGCSTHRCSMQGNPLELISHRTCMPSCKWQHALQSLTHQFLRHKRIQQPQANSNPRFSVPARCQYHAAAGPLPRPASKRVRRRATLSLQQDNRLATLRLELHSKSQKDNSGIRWVTLLQCPSSAHRERQRWRPYLPKRTAKVTKERGRKGQRA